MLYRCCDRAGTNLTGRENRRRIWQPCQEKCGPASGKILPMPVAPLEQILPDSERDRIRVENLKHWRFYNPWVHLGITSGFGGAVMALAVALIHDVKWW